MPHVIVDPESTEEITLPGVSEYPNIVLATEVPEFSSLVSEFKLRHLDFDVDLTWALDPFAPVPVQYGEQVRPVPETEFMEVAA